MRAFFRILCTTVLCFAPIVSFGQLRVQFVDQVPLDGTSYPLLSAQVRATLNGAPFVLTTANVLIQEDVQVTSPLSVTAPDAGVQTIRWYTRSRNVRGGNATVIIFDKNATASAVSDSASGLGKDSRVAQVRFHDTRSKPTKEASFGNVTAGSSLTLGLFCVPTSGRFLPDMSEDRIRVDSISTETEFFKAVWIGGPGAWSFPGKMSSPLEYSMSVTFSPKENKYYHDVLTVYYEGGAVERLQLSGNVFPLPMRTTLNITEPNGGEVLYPCQQKLVKWTGAGIGSTTIVEYSVDQGKSWLEIARSKDSSLVWKIPDTPTDNLQLRVRAEQENLSENILTDQNRSACDRIGFRPDSQTLLSCYRNGEAFEWDMMQNTVSSRYTMRADRGLNAGTTAFGCGYSSASAFFIAYRNTSSSSKSDTLAFFQSGTSTPLSTIALDSTVRYKAALIDSSRSSIVLVPQMGTVLTLRSAADGSVQRTVSCAAPVTAVSLGKDKAIVSLLDGRIVIFSLPDWTEKQTLTFTAMPVIDQILLLPDNQRIAVGCHATASTQNEGAFSDGYVIDIANALIIRTQRKSSTSPVCVSVNSTSRYVIFGYIATPQAPMWDISPNQMYSSIVTHGGSLTDLSFSPSGTLLATSANATDNLHVRQFIYPEIDYTDAPIRIVRQDLSAVSLTIDSTYAFSTRDTVVTANICNKGLVPVVINDKSFESGSHFVLSGALSPDTVLPGSCIRIPMRFVPLDTGLLSDAFHVVSCAANFKLPVQGYSIPRKLGIPDTVEFGDVCPNAVYDKDITIVTNADPVSIVLNQAFLSDETNTWFKVLTTVKNDTVAAKGTYTIKIRFKPLDIGPQEKVLLLFYGNQRRIYARIVLRGRGAGSRIDIIPTDVAFITPEPRRTVVIRNPNDNVVVVNALTITPSTAFTLDAVTTPATIAAHDSLVLHVNWLDTNITQGRIDALIAPCSVPLVIPLVRYQGSATLSLPLVKADPIGDAIIPIQLRIAENVPYAAERTLDAEFSVNPRLFIPQTIESWLGAASITRNEIVNDRRIIGLSIRGNFPQKDTVIANLRGPAGLGETDRSTLIFNKQSRFFGTSVQVATVDGELQLINLCGDRRVIVNGTLDIVSITPAPATTQATLHIASSLDDDAVCDIYAASGELIETLPIHLSKGSVDQVIACDRYANGTYTVVLRSGMHRATALFLLSR